MFFSENFFDPQRPVKMKRLYLFSLESLISSILFIAQSLRLVLSYIFNTRCNALSVLSASHVTEI